ncbi:MAG: SpaA isopeptide-forming pilin-related protein [Firmicutes bacterium]|nr:SpaA isopeptide-forming pilin-related protein [Bacillota bacterium]
MKKRGQNRREEKPVSYWQSMADVVSCTLLIFILLASIAAFSSWHRGDQAADTSSSAQAATGESDVGPYHADNAKTRADGNGDGAGTGAAGEENPSSGGGQQVTELGPGNTSAVRVEIVDQESGEVIPEAGVTFALYTSAGRQLALHTYYPELVSYQKFETEQDGSFYLPEKLSAGNYYLHELTAAKGYGLAADTSFLVEEGHDWSDPILVKVELGEATGVLQLELTDAETGNPIEGVRYQVIAAEDLNAQTKSGDICAELVTDAQGLAASDPLYLGNYELRQLTAPDGYALPDSDSTVTVAESTKEEPQKVDLTAEKTSIRVDLTDKNQGTPLAGAVFTLADSSGAALGTYETDASGEIRISSLRKNTSYQLTETAPPDGYLPEEEPVSFAVDGSGRINGQASAAISLENAPEKTDLVTTVTKELPVSPLVLLLIGAGVLLVLLVLLIRAVRHRKKKKQDDSSVDGMYRR